MPKKGHKRTEVFKAKARAATCKHLGVPVDPVERFWFKVDVRGPDECHPWAGSAHTVNGVRRAKFWFEGKNRNAARVMWQLERGPIPANICVLHTCDNPMCVNINHLFLGDSTTNTRDMMVKGRVCRRECHPRAKLNSEKVKEIHRLYATGEYTYKELAQRFDVTKYHIGKVIRGKAWAHVV